MTKNMKNNNTNNKKETFNKMNIINMSINNNSNKLMINIIIFNQAHNLLTMGNNKILTTNNNNPNLCIIGMTYNNNLIISKTKTTPTFIIDVFIIFHPLSYLFYQFSLFPYIFLHKSHINKFS